MKTSKFSSQVKANRRRERRYVDLHMHSCLSDGEMKVDELVHLCSNRGLSAISITDHDNIDAFEEGKEVAESLGIEFIPGVEISAHSNGSDIHILGYYFDPTHLELNLTLKKLKEKRKNRARTIIRHLQKQGLQITYSQVEEKADKGGCIGRAHIASVLVQEEYVGSFREAFDRFLSTEILGDIEDPKISPINAINLIIQAGGVPVLAHPSKTRQDHMMDDLVDAGLKGIETFGHGLSRSVYQRYRNMAKYYSLFCSGGTDFHKCQSHSDGPGSVKVPYQTVEMMRACQG